MITLLINVAFQPKLFSHRKTKFPGICLLFIVFYQQRINSTKKLGLLSHDISTKLGETNEKMVSLKTS